MTWNERLKNYLVNNHWIEPNSIKIVSAHDNVYLNFYQDRALPQLKISHDFIFPNESY
jgi:hypothetical protein